MVYRQKRCFGFMAIVLTALIFTLTIGTQQASAVDVVVRKQAADANPPLYVSSLDMSPEVKELMQSTLHRCGWFDIVSSSQEDAFSLRALSKETASGKTLKIRLKTAGNKTFSFTIRAKGVDNRKLVYRAVDTVIKKVFNKPGPCESRIAYVKAQNGRKEIKTCNFDGSEVRQLTYNRSISTEPSWGRNGQYLAYTLYDRNKMKTVLVNMGHDRQRIVSASPGLNSGPAISPGGDYVALSMSRKGSVDLFVKSLKNNKIYRVTSGSGVESSPVWSPGGDRLCFVSDRAGRPHLYITKVNNREADRLTGDSAEEVSPDWSELSNKIVFSTRQGGRYKIAVLDMTKKNPEKRILNTGTGDWESPSWSPDGRHIVCTRSHGGQKKLFMVDTISGKGVPILQGADISLPDWGMIPGNP